MIFTNLNVVVDKLVPLYCVLSMLIIFCFFAIERASAPSLRKKEFLKHGSKNDFSVRFNGLWVVSDIEGIESWCNFTEQNTVGYILFSMV